MEVTPSASYSVTVRVEIHNAAGMLGKLTSEIGQLGGDIGAVDIVSIDQDVMVRDLTINCRDNEHAQRLVDAIGALDGVKLLHHSDRTFLLHLGGKSKSSAVRRSARATIYPWPIPQAWRVSVWRFMPNQTTRTT